MRSGVIVEIIADGGGADGPGDLVTESTAPPSAAHAAPTRAEQQQQQQQRRRPQQQPAQKVRTTSIRTSNVGKYVMGQVLSQGIIVGILADSGDDSGTGPGVLTMEQ
jgi:hypothetical protein